MATGANTAALLVATVALSACGGDSEEPPAPAGPPTAMVTMSKRKFTPREVNAAAEEPIAVHNAGTVGHDLQLRRNGKEVGGTPVLNPGQTLQLEVLFDPGEYEMYCSVPGHEEAGMEGTFRVVE